MDERRKTIQISVRALVEFILREGDLDNRTGGRAELSAMQAGSRLHRKIQRRMGAGYAAEIPLKELVPMEGFDCLLEGRADGIFEEDGLVYVDEIKGTFRDVNLLEEPVGVHLAQALCYAHIYAEQKELSQIGVQLTYGNLETEQLKYFRFVRKREELTAWFEALMKEYEKWARFQFEWRMLRTESIRPLQFPFPYREGQRELAAGVYRTIARKKRLFIQAPTGVGKTMSTVFPAVKAIGEGLGEGLFYLTAKTVTRTVAEEAFRILRKEGLRLKAVTLTAKEKLCLCEETDCNPDACPYAKGHFDRINNAVYELLTEGPDELSRDAVILQAEKHRVCPFELSLDTASWTDAVICDYNYVFDPNVRLKRFFAEGIKGEYLFLIDEAHNLVERGREMFSAALCKEDFLELKRKLQGRYKKAERCLEQCNKYLLGLKRECETYQLHEDVGAFALKLLSLFTELDKIREEGAEPELQKEILEFWFQIRDFLSVFERLGEDYVIYSEIGEDGRFRLKLYCVETARNLRECLDKGNAAVFFSATLLPMPYYKHLLGEEDDYAVYAQSPFEQEKRLILVGRDVSSRYTRRTRTEYEKIAAYLAAMTEGKPGNYLAFFPSYKMMLDVYEAFAETYEVPGRCTCILQKSGMREEEREEFLDRFRGTQDVMTEQEVLSLEVQGVMEEKEDPDRDTACARGESLLGFCVLGGIFSEGIDLKQEALIGAAVIGTGLPQICHEREILRSFYDNQGMDGFAYAYRYPGINKVLQAAGRVIRTREDEGVILLLDSRFLDGTYSPLFPREWDNAQVSTLRDAKEKIKTFWEKMLPENRC